MTRSLKINEVIERRAPLARRLKEVEGNLGTAMAALCALEECRDEIMSLVEPETSAPMTEISFTATKERMLGEQASLGRLRRRFERTTLNLGVVGRARQGKSRLLQSLTGLSAKEIPDGDRQHCTGVRSTIFNADVDEAYADVEFYTEHAFIEEVLLPYYRNLKLAGSLVDLDSFADSKISELRPEQLDGHAEPRAKYEHLKRYQQNLGAYRDLIGSQTTRIGVDNIRQYVAQDDVEGNRKFHSHMAVKEVRIYCRFPLEDVGQVAVVDMPGLGDTGVGDEERLIRSLGKDVDFVLFVRMPRSSGDHWADTDVQLYDVARSSLTDLPVEKWSMMILNNTGPGSRFGDNSDLCGDLKGEITTHHLNVVAASIADCSNPDQTSTLVLDPVLNYLVEHIAALDLKYASACEERLRKLSIETQAGIKRFDGFLELGSAATTEFDLFQRSFGRIYSALSVGIEGKVRHLRKHADDKDERFTQRVHQAMREAKKATAAPSLEQVEVLRDTEGSYDRAYYFFLDQMRTTISECLLGVDDSLHDSLDAIKEECAAVFREKGRLAVLSNASGAQFFREIREQHMDAEHGKLDIGFSLLETFTLSFRGFIQHRIRPHLDCLTPDLTDRKLPTQPTGEQVIDLLQVAHNKVFYKLDGALSQFFKEPSLAAFAIVEDFKDRVLRATGRPEEDLQVKNEWQDFYYGLRSDIWPDEFDALGEQTRIRKRWEAILQCAIDTCQVQHFSFSREQGAE